MDRTGTSRPGAFIDLAADIRYEYHLSGQVVIDGRLDKSLANGRSGMTGLNEFD